MKARRRQLSQKKLSGYWVTGNQNNRHYRDIEYYRAICDDYHQKKVRADGSLPPTNFDMDIVERDPYLQTNTLPANANWLYGLPVDDRDRVPGFDAIYKQRDTAARSAENAALVQELLAKTHPFRHKVSAFVMVFELIEATSLLKLAAGSLLRFASGNYLNVHFGWDTLFADVKNLATIHVEIMRREKELTSLSLKGGLRRRIDLKADSSTLVVENVCIQSTLNHFIYATNISTRKIRFSGSVRWKLKDGYKNAFERLDKHTLAIQKVLDLDTPDYPTLWEAIPLSWLVDYLVDLSEFFQANNNQLEVEPYDICIMRHWRSTLSQQVTQKPKSTKLTGTGKYRRDVKSRDVCSKGLYPAVTVPVLSLTRILNIAALATLLLNIGRK